MRKRIAVISGASKGLGQQLVPYLEEFDYQVIKLGLNSEGIVDYRTDLTSRALSDELVSKINQEYGDISLLIANAGGGKRPSISNSKDQEFEFFMQRNFLTARNLIEASMNSLIRAKGSIIAISSIVAIKHVSNAPFGYVQSKKALNAFIKETALNQAKNGVRANIISPGNIYFSGSRWEELQNLNPQMVSNTLEKDVPLGRFIAPVEIAAAIRFLSSKEAYNITGANLVIDGGQSL
jgi:3-oxoacyl-[acyl-carrier protein] reductase